MNNEVLKAMEEQINYEMYSGYVYLKLSLLMEKLNYKGYAYWLKSQYKEEFEHAEDFISFLQKRDSTPELSNIAVEDLSFDTPMQVAEFVLGHEQKVTNRIYQLHDIAKKNNDYATEIFLHSFISEQIQEENVAQDIVDKFTFAGDSTAACYAVDRELGCKKFRSNAE